MSSTEQRADRDVTTWLGLGVVGVAAAVQSFAALSDLAHMVGLTGVVHFPWPGATGCTFHLSWLLPITVDVFAAVATRIWLQGRAAREAVLFARRAAWAAIVATVGGNAYHGLLTGAGRIDTVVISAAFPVALGGLVHLAVLVRRPPGGAGADRSTGPGRAVRWRAAAVAWWEMRKAERKAADGRRADAGDTGRETGGPPVPTGVDSNDVIAADLRRLNADRRAEGKKPLGRDAVVDRYRVGSGRADTIRELAKQSPAPARPHLVPDTAKDDEGEASA